MIIIETLWEIIQSIFISALVLCILYVICEFFDRIEYKRFEKDMNEYLKQKHKHLSDEIFDYDLHLQYMMREWNW